MTTTKAAPEEGREQPSIEAGVDWFRSIVPLVGEGNEARNLAVSIQEGDCERGGKRRPWSFMGYEGTATDSLRVGIRDGRMLWECSSAAAASTWHRLAQFGGQTTRVDLQVTLEFAQPQPTYGRRCFARSGSPRRTGLPRLTRIGTQKANDGLWLGTAGRRTSEEYYRLYDKGVESKSSPPGTKWRLELEAKGGLARSLTEEMCALRPDPNWFYKRVVSSWKSQGFAWPCGVRSASLPPVARPAAPEPTSIGLGLWISTSVRPVMRRALKVFSDQQLLELLDLVDVYVPIRPPHDQPR